MLSVVANEQARDELRLDLNAIVREGARRMLAAALEAEVDDYLAAHAAERDEQGRRLVVRNGHARRREVLTAAGAVAARAPRVNDRRTDPVTGGRVGFRSVVLPPWCRKSPKVGEVLPLLYLHGLSTGDFVPALEAFFGSAAGLSAAAIGRLLAGWQADYQAFAGRDLSDRDYVYAGRAPDLDDSPPSGRPPPEHLRHTFATWLQHGGIPRPGYRRAKFLMGTPATAAPPGMGRGRAA
jgi:putative transposase